MELSREDVIRLLSDPSPEARAQVAAKIGYSLADVKLSDNEIKLAQDIVRHMAGDLTLQVRVSLAASVKNAKKLPHDVALKLAKDVAEVSLPVLEFSEILSDEDLVDIIRGQSPEKQQAIAKRDHVSEKVSGVLVDEAAPVAVASLLQNNTAQISETSLEKAADKFKDDVTMQDTIARREPLPLALAERLVARVSEALRDQLVKKHNIPATVLNEMINQNREQNTVKLLAGQKDEQDVVQLTIQLKKTGRLTPSLIIRGLCVGDIPFFEASLAALADVPITNARVLIHEAGKLGLKSLYDKTGLPAGMFSIIRVALEVVKEMQMDGGDHGQERYRARVIERILTQYQDFEPDDLNYLLDRLDDLMEKAA